MKLKDAYMKAFKEELQPLVDAGKITLLGTLEDLAEDVSEASVKALKKGAVYSEDKWDDMVVPPAADFIASRIAPMIDKIDPTDNLEA